MNAMLVGVVGRIADELRLALSATLAEASECDPASLVAELGAAGLLDRPELARLLLRRTDSIRVREALSPEGAPDSILRRFAADGPEEVASEAMAVVLARAASRDRFGRPGLDPADCPADTAVQLAYAVAAALSRRCGGAHEELVAAAVNLLAWHDEGRRLESLEARLVLALDRAQRIDVPLLLALGGAGEIGLLAEALARLAGIPGESGWALLSEPREGRFALLLRMAGQSRATAASLFVRLAIPLRMRDPAGEIDRFDALGTGEIESARTRLRLPPDYRDAILAMDEHGQRPF